MQGLITQKKMQKRLSKLLGNTLDTALRRRARLIIENINPNSGDKILDVGCGDGYYLHLLSNLGIRDLSLTGIDYDEKALISAKKNLKGKNIKFEVVNLMKKSKLKASYYDKVVMSEVAEHLPDDIKGLKEIHRLMKKGGILALTVPNANYPLLWDPINKTLEFLFGYHFKSGFLAGIWNQHERLYTPEQIEQVVKKAGFKVRKLKSLTFWSLPFNHYIINAGARILASGVKSRAISGANKFKSAEKKSLINDLYFKISSMIDRLNDFYAPKNQGVGVFVLAEKK